MWVLGYAWDSPAGDPPPAPATTLRDVTELRTALSAAAAAEPRCYALRSPAGAVFSLYLGGPWAGAGCSWHTDGRRWYRSALTDPPLAPDGVLFDNGREGVYLGPHNLFPAADMIEAAAHYFERGVLSPQFQWIGWEGEPSASADRPRD